MKNKLFMLLCGLLVCFISACSDDEQEQQAPPKETPEVIKEVVETLKEAAPQASDFLEILKQTDLTGVTAEKLTVFAVKNETPTRTGMGLDTTSVKRHVAIGSYKKEELTDGQELTSIGGDKLLVSRIGEEVSVNGVVITGEAIPAGDSYIYIVSKVIPEHEEKPILHETTFKVWNLLNYDYMDDREPLADVTIKVFNTSKEFLGDYITETSGDILVRHASDTILYQLVKEGYQTCIDYNGDGKINTDELTEGKNILIYDGNNNEMIWECFMKRQASPLIQASEAQKQWKAQIRNFYYQNRTLNQELSYGYHGFSYNNIESVSGNYWKNAYKTIDLGIQLQEIAREVMNDKDLWNELLCNIKVDMGLIYSDVLGYYGQYIFKNTHNDEGTAEINALFDYLEKVTNELPSNYTGALRALAARVYLNNKKYQEAYYKCKELIERGDYTLSNEDVFATVNNKAVVWGGYDDTIPDLRKGEYFHPVRYVEVLLMMAEAANETGNTIEAIQALNLITEAKGQPIIALPGATQEEIRGYIKYLFLKELCNEGLEYSTWRRWGIADQELGKISGYKIYNSLLPVPQNVLDQYPVLEQNPGY